MDGLPPLPRFLIIGAQKSATRWFRLNLGRHPEIFTPDQELSHFCKEREYARGIEHYRSRFAGWSGEPVVGEATPGYMMWNHVPETVAERIDRDLPGVQLFAVLRDPVERLYSAFLHHVRRGRFDPDVDVVELVLATPVEDHASRDGARSQRELVAGGWYARSLEPYFERFGSRLRVFLNDDAREDPGHVYAEALRALGVDDSFVPEGLGELRFSGGAPRASRYWVPGAGRRALTAQEKQALYPLFAADIDRLEALLGRDLSAWRHVA